MEPHASLDSSLSREAAVLARYLIGREPASTLTARYINAEQTVGRKDADRLDRQIVDFAVQHYWAIAGLDTACAVLRPQAVLREKLLRLAAVLEASPEGAQDFLPKSAGPAATLFWLAAIAARSAAQLAVGAALLKGIELRDRLERRGQ